MSSPKVAVFDYGAGNVHSACQALRRVGAQVELTSEVRGFDGVLVPGVGAFGYVIDRFLKRSNADLFSQRPTFGVCVGMQILFQDAEEKGHHKGLGILSGTVAQLPAPRLPHMGWAPVNVAEPMKMFDGIEDECFYFVHSYARAALPPVLNLQTGAPVTSATATHEVPFVAALESGALWATQFHPEKSGPAGLQILHNWIQQL